MKEKWKRFQPRVLLISLLSIFLLQGVVLAGTTGKIAGKVIDAESGEPLIGANLIIVELSTGAASDIEGMVIGGHSDTGMIPLTRLAVRNSIPVSAFLTEEQIKAVAEATKVGGATLTKMLGTSAWYAPGAAVSSMVQAIACDHKKMFACSALLEGEYGLDDICLGVPCIIGKNGIESIVQLDLSDAEKENLHNSADAVRVVNNLLESVS